MDACDREERMSMIDPSIKKIPIQRLQPSLNRFIKALGTGLDRLHQHKTYIMRYDKRQKWDSLDRELINATRTMQQIKRNMLEIERTRIQVATEELFRFDERIEDIKMSASADLAEFVGFSDELIALIQKQKQNEEAAEQNEKNESISEPSLLSDDLVLPPSSVTTSTKLMQLQPLPENSEVMESWESLQESLLELNSLVQQFAVHNQQEAVDRIEDNLEKAGAFVWEGVKQLGKAANYKTVLVPMTGALLGALVAGPIGLLGGAKVGSLAVIGGGVAGAAGGKALQKQQEKQVVEEVEVEVDVEMIDMNKRKPSEDGTCVPNKISNILAVETPKVTHSGTRRLSENAACVQDKNGNIQKINSDLDHAIEMANTSRRLSEGGTCVSDKNSNIQRINSEPHLTSSCM